MNVIVEIKIVIDKETLYEYDRHYFKLHPRARKSPIKEPIHPSINTWMIMRRPEMNDLKQKWKDFIIYLIDKHGYSDLKVEKASITFKIYKPTKRRFDNDNFSPKFIMDGLVESGMIVDDDYNHINPLVIYGGYDKENPRTEIYIKINKEK